jgi:hypothetical protein
MSKSLQLWQQMANAFFFATDDCLRSTFGSDYASDEVAAYMAGGEL